MSIFPAIFDLLVAEQPIHGDVVTIGRQRVEPGCFLGGRLVLTDSDLFMSLGASTVRALDALPNEGAKIIHNLNNPLPGRLYQIADFIYDGSCLDNIFNSANALISFSKMLRPGGRMMLFEHSTSMQSALVMFSPEWFFNYFAVNEYEDCQITLFTFPDKVIGMQGKWKSHWWQCYVDDKPAPTTVKDAMPWIGDFVTVVVAKKGLESTDDRCPMQTQYEHRSYLMAHRRFMANSARKQCS